MRVAFDTRVLADPATSERGIGRYARSLFTALRAGGHDLVTLEPVGRPRLPERFAELLEHPLLGRDARKTGASVLHSPSIDFATTRPGMPYVVTVHDLVPLKRPKEYLRTGVKHKLRYGAVERATRLIVPTRTVAADCARLLRVDPARIDVIPEAAADTLRRVAEPAGILARFELPERFLLWVGGLDPPDPRKGVAALVGAVASGDGPPLVLVGRVGSDALGLLHKDRVFLTGHASDEELAAIYSAADALVFPSDEEGYGLPVIEALACGTPVAAYDIPALREQWATHDSVALVEPHNLQALLDAAAKLTGADVKPPTRTWSEVAEETWRAYERAARP